MTLLIISTMYNEPDSCVGALAYQNEYQNKEHV